MVDQYNELAVEALKGGKDAWDAFVVKYFQQPRPSRWKDGGVTSTYGGFSTHNSSGEKIPLTDDEWKISLKGAPLSGLDLAGFDFTRAELKGAVVNLTNLSYATFGRAPNVNFDLGSGLIN